MAISELRPFLEDAKKNHYALGCFNVFNIETLEGVLEAAVNLKTPVVCAVYEPQLKYGDLETFANLVKDISNRVNIPVILHLDHAYEISSTVNAIRCGFTSVMFDGPPDISFEEKVDKTKKVVDIAHSVNVMVEAELGYITRVGVDESQAGKNIADPELAAQFVSSTGIDILAPAIGSIHGLEKGKATLDLELLKKIKDKTDCCLSLHGGSGISPDIVKEAISIGINKSSVYTRLSELAKDKLQKLLSRDSVDLAELLNEVRDGFKDQVEEILKMLGSVNICSFEANVCNFCSSTKYCVQPGTSSGEDDYRALVEKISNEVIRKVKDR